MDGITHISANGPHFNKALTPEATRQHEKAQDVPPHKVDSEPAEAPESLLAVYSELATIAPQINQRLEFSYVKALGQVVVKIIDKETDTLIKELPPIEFQQVHIALREALGLLVDKRV